MTGMRALAAALLLAAAPAAGASAEARCPLPPSGGGAAAVAGAYPAPGSVEAANDLAVVLWEQRTRTPADVARAAAEEELSLEDYAAALGTGFEVARHPLTEALLAQAVAASRPCVAAAKGTHRRPRPYVADPRVKPTASPESSASFPSGHATRGALLAALLAELAPRRREALLARGAQIGHDRVIAGVHYPSDVAAGERLGHAVAQALVADPAFRAALEDVRAREWPAGAGAPVPSP
jgi:membrane-associated phospholipid phosphatase